MRYTVVAMAVAGLVIAQLPACPPGCTCQRPIPTPYLPPAQMLPVGPVQVIPAQMPRVHMSDEVLRAGPAPTSLVFLPSCSGGICPRPAVRVVARTALEVK